MKTNERQPQPQPGCLTNNAEWKKQDPVEPTFYDPSQMKVKTRQNIAQLFGEAQSNGKTEEKKKMIKSGRCGLWGKEKGHTAWESPGMFCFLTQVLVRR